MTASPKRVARNATSQFVTYGLSWAAKGLAAFAVARSLGPPGMGVFAVAWTVATILSFLAPLGVDTWLIRELNRDRGRSEIGSMLRLSALLGIAFGAGVAIVPVTVGAPANVAAALVAAALYVAASPPALVLRASFHARERMELETATTAVEGVVALAAVGLMLATGAGVVGAMIGLGAGRLANVCVATTLHRRLWSGAHASVAASPWIDVLRASLPMGVAYMFTTLLLRFDVIVLGAMRGSQETGLYGAAALVVLAVPVVASALVSALYPALSRFGDADDPSLSRIVRVAAVPLLGTGLVAAAALSVTANDVMRIGFGASFAAGAPMLAVLAWVLPFRFLNVLCGTTLNATDRRRRRTVVVVAGVGCNLAFNLALVPAFGAWGTVWSSLLTEVALLGLMLWSLHPLRPRAVRPLLQGGAIALVTAAALGRTPGPFVVRAAVGLLTFGGLALAAWARPLRELRGPRHSEAEAQGAAT